MNPFVMTIPYRSQWDSDANARSADCGAACCAMLAQWQGIDKPINSFPHQSSSNGLTTAAHLVQNLTDIGLDAITIELDKLAPTPRSAICLNWYGGFERSSVQDTGYTGWHWMILLHEDETQVLCHDPDWWGSRRNEGAYHRFTRAEWDAAFIPYPGDSTKTAVALLLNGDI